MSDIPVIAAPAAPAAPSRVRRVGSWLGRNWLKILGAIVLILFIIWAVWGIVGWVTNWPGTKAYFAKQQLADARSNLRADVVVANNGARVDVIDKDGNKVTKAAGVAGKADETSRLTTDILEQNEDEVKALLENSRTKAQQDIVEAKKKGIAGCDSKLGAEKVKCLDLVVEAFQPSLPIVEDFLKKKDAAAIEAEVQARLKAERAEDARKAKIARLEAELEAANKKPARTIHTHTREVIRQAAPAPAPYVAPAPAYAAPQVTTPAPAPYVAPPTPRAQGQQPVVTGLVCNVTYNGVLVRDFMQTADAALNPHGRLPTNGGECAQWRAQADPKLNR